MRGLFRVYVLRSYNHESEQYTNKREALKAARARYRSGRYTMLLALLFRGVRGDPDAVYVQTEDITPARR